jgi:nicotinamidase-related amidase
LDQGLGEDSEEAPGSQQMNPHVDIGTHALSRNAETMRGECLCDEGTDYVIRGQKKPSLIHQFGKLDLASMRPPIIGASDNEQPILEQDLHFHVISREGHRDASNRGGMLIMPLQDVFPEQKPIDRTFINTWEDTRVVEAVKKTGRKKIIMAALWSEICLAMPAIQAAGEGYEVYAVTDASGGVSAEAHEMAIRRMVMAGVVPITWMAVAGELQRDWARQEQAAAMAGIFLEHGGGTGIALAWELQLLGHKAAAGA